MGSVLAAIAAVALVCAAFQKIKLIGTIAMLIGGGIGFAIGPAAGSGWAIFGAILGGLIGIAAIESNRTVRHD